MVRFIPENHKTFKLQSSAFLLSWEMPFDIPVGAAFEEPPAVTHFVPGRLIPFCTNFTRYKNLLHNELRCASSL